MSGAVPFPKPRVLRELPSTHHAVIEASAGTGKTYTLEHLVIELLLGARVSLDRILVVTFTEKAAAELRARLRAKLTAILRTEGQAPGPDEDAWPIDEAARARLSRALTSFDAASISTIHGFCHRMLAEHAFDNRRLFSETLVDGKSAFSRAFFIVLRRHLAKEPRFQAFLEAWLDEHSLEDLVSLLFDAHTRRGALRPALRIDALQAAIEQANKLPLTPNALRPALKKTRAPAPTVKAILRRIGMLRPMLTRYHESGRLGAFLADLSKAEKELEHGGGLLPYLVERLEGLAVEEGKLTFVRDGLKLLDAATVPLESAVVQVFLPIVREVLEEDKTRRGELDFDDMLRLLYEGLESEAGAGLVRTLRERFEFALIDEFQDTDEVQWAIFRRLFLDEGAQGRLFVIGDPKQAIYGFRGADVRTYLSARHRLERAGGRQVHLVKNFRSSAAVIAAVNQLLSQRRRRPFFTGEIRYDHPVECGAPDQAGLEHSGAQLPPVQLVRVRPRKTRLSSSAARRTIADAFTKHILRLLDPRRGAQRQTEDGPAPLVPSDIYVLTRTAKEGLELGRHLRRAGVPHAFYKQDGLFQTREADDVRAVLAAIAEPHRRSRRVRAWQSPFFSVPLDALAACADLPGTHPFMERLLEWKSLAETKDYDRLFTRIVEDSGIIERELFLEDSERELTNYLHVFEILTEHASRTKGTLQEIIHTLTAFIDRRKLPEGEDGNVQRLESERDAVQIMTMHKAKGLEAQVVFVFGGFDKTYGRSHIFHDEGSRALWIGPHPPDAAQVEADEEDQRLLYVALTRAKARLYLPYFGFAPEPGTGASEGHGARELDRLEGTYRQLNEQLDDVVARLGEPEIADLFAYEEVDELPFFRDAPAPGTHLEVGGWSPPAALLDTPAADARIAPLRQARLGRVVTSYSRVKAAKGGYQAPTAPLVDPSGSDERMQAVDATTVPRDAKELPGGTASGRFLHEMLERVALDGLQGGRGLAEWSEDPEVLALFAEGIDKYDRDPAHMPHALELVHTTMTAPLHLPAGDLRGGLAEADRIVREMEFLFPIPEAADPPLGAPAPQGFSVERGFVKGFVDLVFEYKGQVYLLDYKSDLLPSYAPDDLVGHVQNNYALQAELYTLALVKLLGIDDAEGYEARFGGAVYTFVRGMRAEGAGTAGVFFTRPEWPEVLASERALAAAKLTEGEEAER